MAVAVGLVGLFASDAGCEGEESSPATTAVGGGTGDGGGGGAATGTGLNVDGSRLGAACATSDECGGLVCDLPAPSSDPSGYAGGICTFTCEDADLCAQVLTGARCIDGLCLEPCEYGPSDLSAADPTKCHGRGDVACYEVHEGGAIRDLCLPTCNVDADCGDPMFCDPAEGFCRPVPPSGLSDGMPCNAHADCMGICFDSTPSQRGVCARVCTLGRVPSCGWDGSGSADYGCLLSQDAANAGFGDGGFCAELCDCDEQCSSPSFVCEPFAAVPHLSAPWAQQVVTGSGRAGLCVDAEEASGGSPGMPCTGGGGGSAGSGGVGGSGGAG
ncbi:MAG: hypothetical protein JRI55_36800, partial [Deltaproteobacteria bacterium]|nr:hypothetical protein [Deltaproteobacteria bacterium]